MRLHSVVSLGLLLRRTIAQDAFESTFDAADIDVTNALIRNGVDASVLPSPLKSGVTALVSICSIA